MGRRSINTTKSGKFMNPTDQARKEARKRELKKNKRQRMMVRQAVLKNKDPAAIIMELKALDVMEFDPVNPPPYNIKVLHEKRRKLKETWERVMKLYSREDPTKVNEMKLLENDYEQRRHELCAYYESVIQAQRVKVEEIPLPDLPTNQPCLTPYMISPGDIPLPPGNGCIGSMPNSGTPVNAAAVAAATAAAAAVVAAKPEIIQQMKASAVKGILKKPEAEQPAASPQVAVKVTNKKPPGPPPGAPPVLSDYSTDSSDSDSENVDGVKVGKRVMVSEKPKKLRFADCDPAADSSCTTSTNNFPAKSANNNSNFDAASLPGGGHSLHRQVISSDSSFYRQQIAMAAAAAARNAINRSAVNLPHLPDLVNMSRIQPDVGRSIVPGHHLSNKPVDPMCYLGSSGASMGPAVDRGVLNTIRGEVRLPVPLAGHHVQLNAIPQSFPNVNQHATMMDGMVVPKQPVVLMRQPANRSSIIEAKPQIRNRMASITKLVPTVLKVKRSEKGHESTPASRRVGANSSVSSMQSRKTDLAYDAFMKEMEGVLR